ncbi:MAG: nuclear transport factor 2 family protein [Solirubrobacterales bacterium]
MTADRREELVREIYDGFNAGDLERAAEVLADEVVWPDALDGGQVQGRESVVENWRGILSLVKSSRIEPTAMAGVGDPTTFDVRVHQTIERADGIETMQLVHRFHFAGEEITELEILDLG